MSCVDSVHFEIFWEALQNLVENGGGFGDFSALMCEAINGGKHSEFISDLLDLHNPYTVKSSMYEGFRSHLIIESRKEFCVFEKELEEEYVHRILSLGSSIDTNQIQKLEETIKQEYEKKYAKRLQELDAAFNERVANEQELKAIYQFVKERFFKDQIFRAQALSKLRKDIDKSLASCEKPIFYDILLDSCIDNEDEIVRMFVETHFDALLSDFGEEIKDEIRVKYEDIVAAELKDELRKDKNFVDKVKADLVNEISSSLFA